jgi:hypothetical protein
MKKNISISIVILSIFILLSSCGIYKPSDARKVSPNDEERIKANQAAGKGLRLNKLMNKGAGGDFQFASSNEMWRATIDVLNFIPLSNVDYGGGVIITDWYVSDTQQKQSIKIMVQFLSNELRADGLKVIIYKKDCNVEKNCETSVSKSKLENEIKLAILKKASLFKKEKSEKKQ